MDRAQLKEKSKRDINGNKGILFLILFILFIMVALANSIVGIGQIATIVLLPVFIVAYHKIYLHLVRGNTPLIEDLFGSMNLTGKAWVVSFLSGLIIALGCILFIVPGIIFALMYSQTKYILADNPDMSIMDCLATSRVMMQGHKAELFVLQLSFIGWYILGAFTCYILTAVYVIPYNMATRANYFYYLKSEYMNNMQSNNPDTSSDYQQNTYQNNPQYIYQNNNYNTQPQNNTVNEWWKNPQQQNNYSSQPPVNADINNQVQAPPQNNFNSQNYNSDNTQQQPTDNTLNNTDTPYTPQPPQNNSDDEWWKKNQ